MNRCGRRVGGVHLGARARGTDVWWVVGAGGAHVSGPLGHGAARRFEGCLCPRLAVVDWSLGEASCAGPVCQPYDAGGRVSMRCGQQSIEGYVHDSRLISGGVRDNELDGDARRTRGFIQVQATNSSVTPYVLRLCGLYCLCMR
jgi:hypothetical protein